MTPSLSKGIFSHRTATQSVSGFLIFCTLLFSVAIPLEATAATKVKTFNKAMEVDRSDFSNFVMAPGSTKQVSVTFKNTGTRTWNRDGSQRVAINTDYPTSRRSIFYDSSWSTLYRPARLPVASVKPGDTATFTFTLHAPKKKGEYIERFYLVGLPEGKIGGGEFSFLITVGSASSTQLYQGKLLSISPNAYNFKPGEGKTITVTFQNTGRMNWRKGAKDLIALETNNSRLRLSDFTTKWVTPTNPQVLRTALVRPGEKFDFTFALKAPSKEGLYTESFQLVAKTLTPISGTSFDLNILVKDPNADPSKATAIIPEPTMRVGITNLNSGIITSCSTPCTFANTDGKTLALIPAATQVTTTYSAGTYTVKAPAGTYTSTSAIRITPDSNGVTAIVNYVTNFDTFRGIIEIHYATATSKLWVINELPMEQYLHGLAEATNSQALEYMKSLAVAARSYALWHWYVSSKHKSENYILNSTTDQVYRGYNYEIKTPNFVKAVDQTKGIVMTHSSAGFDKNPLNIALGAYSSGTDGRTRGFVEVWGGKTEDWEWLVSVPDPVGVIPNATTLSGNHMVGMSATGALRYAVNQGKTFDWILKYYYSGIDLKTLY